MVPPEPGASAMLWEALDRLLDRAPVSGILAHKLGPLAADRLRRRGMAAPPVLQAEQRGASFSMLTAPPLLQRVRSSCEGPLVLFKGPELARLYPGSARRFGDLDLVTPQPEAMYRSLLANGFVEAPDPEGTPDEHHHLEPLRLPGLPLLLEVHARPSWRVYGRGPRLDEILEAAIPSSTGVEGVLAPAPAHHAVLLAAHAWGHEPLRTLRDLVDVAAVTATAHESEHEIGRIAAAWGCERVWGTTTDAIDCLFYGGRAPLALRTWARHLPQMRERSRTADHLQRWVHAFWEEPPRDAARSCVRRLYEELTPAAGETWRQKAVRTARALRDPHAPVTRGAGEERARADARREPPVP